MTLISANINILQITLCLLLLSCKTEQKEEFAPIIKLEFNPLPSMKDSREVIKSPPFIPPVIIEYPSCPEYPPQPPHHLTDTIYRQKEPYIIVEKMPEYDGGTEAMIKYIRENLTYPQSTAEISIQGRVIVRFIVTKNGEIKEPKVIRGLASDLDIEAVRVIESMSPWIPGEQNGEKVDVYFTIPVIFRLE